MNESPETINHILDWDYGPDAPDRIRILIRDGADINAVTGGEAPIHVAARRRRLDAIQLLLELGADIDAKTKGGQSAFAHTIRRGFNEISGFLEERGADTSLSNADLLAVAVGRGMLKEAAEIVLEDPDCVKTGNPEEDRLLADMAGREAREAVKFLIDCGADLTAYGLDDGTPLHQAAWFGQPANAALLIDAGAPLDIFDTCHNSSPLHWAVHGSRYSGHAQFRQSRYVTLVEMLLDAGSSLNYPGDESDSYLKRLFTDATESVKKAMEGKGLVQPEN